MRHALAVPIALALLLTVGANSASARPERGLVYVVSQGLCYETFAAADTLPDHGPFQLILPSTICGPASPTTTFNALTTGNRSFAACRASRSGTGCGRRASSCGMRTRHDW